MQILRTGLKPLGPVTHRMKVTIPSVNILLLYYTTNVSYLKGVQWEDVTEFSRKEPKPWCVPPFFFVNSYPRILFQAGKVERTAWCSERCASPVSFCWMCAGSHHLNDISLAKHYSRRCRWRRHSALSSIFLEKHRTVPNNYNFV